MNRYDAIIIGGGLSGSAAGILLARAGKRVRLYEKEPEARHKVCGEFISSEAQHYLEQLGIDLKALGAVPITHMELAVNDRWMEHPLPASGMSLPRKKLDECLLGKATEAGAEVVRGIRISSADYLNGRWHLHDAISAPALFLATGKHNLGALPRQKGKKDDFIGFKMYYQLGEPPSAAQKSRISIAFLRGGYAGLQPVEGNKANLCLVVDKKTYASLGKSWEGLMQHLLASNRLLAERLDGADACWPRPFSIYKIPYGLVQRDDGQPGLYRLGDQVAVIPSFTGSGISIALHTAFLATRHCLNAYAGQYYSEVHKSLAFPVRLASLAGRLSRHHLPLTAMIASPTLAGATIDWLFHQTRLPAST